MITKKILPLLLLLLPAFVWAQSGRMGENVEYSATLEGTTSSGDIAPFWFTNNRYGLGTNETTSGLVRASLKRSELCDSLRRWRVGYGLDAAGFFSKEHTRFVLQQAYADLQWEVIRLSLGQKERTPELKNPLLSSGGLTLGMNARPLPQVRLELPDFWNIPGTRGWLAIKGHLAYGWYTDNVFQRKMYKEVGDRYTAGSLFHSKAGFMRIGNKDAFPLTLVGGLEMACQFGGTAYGIVDRAGKPMPEQHLSSGPKAYLDALFMGGSDVNDGEAYANAAGNHIGSWHLRLDYHGKGWGIGAYAEHQFEDHSQLFLQYAWKDMLYGVELNLPRNPVVSSLVYEHLRTTDQSGPLYHDKTQNIPEQISAMDNYYNNHVYGAWQHSGFVMGTPLILSPIYNESGILPGVETEGHLRVFHNRVTAHHIGIMGQPHRDVNYRVLYTQERSLGSYASPTANPMTGHYILAECSYAPRALRGLSFKLSYGHNGGNLLRKSDGAMLTVNFSGIINKTEVR